MIERFTSGLRRRRTRLLIGLPLLALLFAANHLEYRWRLARIERRRAEAPAVRFEGNVLGHSTIGVEENGGAGGGAATFLRFALLGTWAFERERSAPCPDAVRALSGRESECYGFMYPLEAGRSIRSFCLLRTTQTCCYGPRPQYNQYLLVETAQPVKFERLTPVLVRGKFFVDPQPDQGFIYRMEAASVAAAGEDEPDVNAGDVARRTKLPPFSFAVLQGMAGKPPAQGKPPFDPAQGKQAAARLPPELLALDGKRVVLEGFVSQRREGTPPQLLISANWWDGVSQSKSPGIYRGLMAVLRDKRQVPPAWKQKAVFIGVLEVQRNAAAWPSDGIVILRDAVLAGADSGTGGRGPILSPLHEAILTIIFLFFAWVVPGRRS